jgi:enoyl-[acyl-carrier protein] reductase / trans-2-enoyl-CoA reductase (NAD+)
MTRDALTHRLRPGGPWQRLLPSTYLAVTGSPTLNQKEMAALLYAGPGSILTGRAAMRGQGIVTSAPSVLDVLVPAKRQCRSVAFVAIHQTTRMPEQAIVMGRLRYAMKPRAVADAARGMTELREVRALVAGVVQDGRCPLEILVRELDRGPIRDSALLRQVLAEVGEGVRSVTEADFLDLIKRGRLPAPLLNARIYGADGTFIACPDAWWPQAGVAAEVDSREWHLRPADWERTMSRPARMSSHGIIVLRPAPQARQADRHPMTERIITPKGRGFLFLDSHPEGCARTVASMRAAIEPLAEARGSARRPVALVIGSSSGYGLAATVAGLARHGITGIGLCFERPPTSRRTATSGWYRSIATATIVAETGADFAFVNADAFADTTKSAVLDLLAERFGGLDCLIYSVAAPRRTDTRTGQTHQSAIRPVGAACQTKTLTFDGGRPQLRDVQLEPATDGEVADTVKVMGGEDWARWIDALLSRRLIRPGFASVALTYIGSSLTSAIYRQGTIGAAKVHLEGTAASLNARLGQHGGRAFTSVNGAAVTQASTAIPGIALYLSLLRSALGQTMRSPASQSADLWDQLLGIRALDLDEAGRIRLDRWELAQDVQNEQTMGCLRPGQPRWPRRH